MERRSKEKKLTGRSINEKNCEERRRKKKKCKNCGTRGKENKEEKLRGKKKNGK